jgi:calcium-dependent protein kinase
MAKMVHKNQEENKLVGTIYYVAPEVIQKKYNEKCDMWSCGVIMYIALTRKIPFFGNEQREIFTNILYRDYKTQVLAKFSENTKDLIRKLLDRNPTTRINAETALTHKFFEEFKITDLLNKIEDEKIEKIIKNLKNYKRKSVLQETTMAYLIHNNPELEEIDDACKLFDKIDVYRKGKITMDDLYVGLSILMTKEKVSDEDIVEIFANLDKNKNNYIGYEEFIMGAIDKNCLLNDNVLKYAFSYFDKDNKGEITIYDISKIFKNNLNTKDINEGLKKIISEVDEGDNKITYDKFCKFMKNIII